MARTSFRHARLCALLAAAASLMPSACGRSAAIARPVASPVASAAAPLSCDNIDSAAMAAGDTGVRDASGNTGSAQTEQTIAVDPTNPDNVVIGFISGVSVSHDGGNSWTLAPVSCTGDNNPAFDRSGMAYFECDLNGVELYRSSHASDPWTGPSSPAGFDENNGDLFDRPWIVRGAGPNSMVVSWESFFSNPIGWVYLKVSNDGGATWGSRHRVDDMNDHPAMQDARQVPVVGADGTIYVAYASGHGPFLDCSNCGALPTDYIVARSSDSGATFQRSVAAANIARTAAPTEESEAISSLAADPSLARSKHLALAWADERSGVSRILVVTSVDGGVSWSAPIDVADDPPDDGAEHDHPQIAFAPDGELIVVWRDRRCSGTGFSVPYRIFGRALSFDGASGALVAGQAVQVTDGPQMPNTNPQFDEYLGMAVGPEGLSVAWNQPRNRVAGTTYRRIPFITPGGGGFPSPAR